DGLVVATGTHRGFGLAHNPVFFGRQDRAGLAEAEREFVTMSHTEFAVSRVGVVKGDATDAETDARTDALAFRVINGITGAEREMLAYPVFATDRVDAFIVAGLAEIEGDVQLLVHHLDAGDADLPLRRKRIALVDEFEALTE